MTNLCEVDPVWAMIDQRIRGSSWKTIGDSSGMDWRTAKSHVEKHLEKMKDIEKAVKVLNSM